MAKARTDRSPTTKPKQPRLPSYRKRAGYAHALVTLTDSHTGKRRDYWLGPHGSPQSREAYHRLIAEWESCGRRFPDEHMSVARSTAGQWHHPPIRLRGTERGLELLTSLQLIMESALVA